MTIHVQMLRVRSRFSRLWRKVFKPDDFVEEDWIPISAYSDQLRLWQEEEEQAKNEEEQRLACQKAERCPKCQKKQRRLARHEEEQRVIRQEVEQRIARQKEEQLIARQEEEQRMTRQEEEQRMTRQEEEQRRARQEEEANRKQMQAEQAKEREETEAAALLSREFKHDTFDFYDTIYKETRQLRVYLLHGERELRFAERRAKLERTRLQKLNRCKDPAERTYWTHALVGRDGQRYF